MALSSNDQMVMSALKDIEKSFLHFLNSDDSKAPFFLLKKLGVPRSKVFKTCRKPLLSSELSSVLLVRKSLALCPMDIESKAPSQVEAISKPSIDTTVIGEELAETCRWVRDSDSGPSGTIRILQGFLEWKKFIGKRTFPVFWTSSAGGRPA